MASITDLAAASSIATTDLLVVNQSGTDRKATAANLAVLVTGKQLMVDTGFTTSTAAKRFSTITAALSAATAGDTISISAGTYTENLTVSQNYLHIVGYGMPTYDSGTGRLVGGTVIRGTIDCQNRPGIVISDLGIDLYGVDSADAITASNTTPTDVYQTFQNLFLLGNGYDAQAHGLLASGGNHISIRSVKLRNWYHGLALRCSFADVDGVDAFACTGNTIIVKSETPSGDALHTNISNVSINGNPADAYQRGGPIRVQSANDGNYTAWCNIVNVTAQNTGEACILIERALETTYRGTVSDVNVVNAFCYNGGDSAARADFDVAGGTNITFTNCHSLARAAGYGFRVRTTDNAAQVKVHSSTCAAGGAGTYTGPFDYLQLNGKTYVGSFVGAGLINVADQLPFQQAVEFSGQINSIVGTAVEIFRMVYTGSGYSGVVCDVIVCCNSGNHVSFDRFRVACERPGSSTLLAAQAQDGTRLASAAGAHGTVTLSVDVGTANTLIVKATGVSYVAAVSYKVSALTTHSEAGNWKFTSKA
jgi:hypothetical protein